MSVPSAILAGLALAALAVAAAPAALLAAPLSAPLSATPAEGPAAGDDATRELAAAETSEAGTGEAGAAGTGLHALPPLSTIGDLGAMLLPPPAPAGLEAPQMLAWPCLDAPGCGEADETAEAEAAEMEELGATPGAALSVAAIPLPAALTLFGISLSALGVLMHRGRR